MNSIVIVQLQYVMITFKKKEYDVLYNFRLSLWYLQLFSFYSLIWLIYTIPLMWIHFGIKWIYLCICHHQNLRIKTLTTSGLIQTNTYKCLYCILLVFSLLSSLNLNSINNFDGRIYVKISIGQMLILKLLTHRGITFYHIESPPNRNHHRLNNSEKKRRKKKKIKWA